MRRSHRAVHGDPVLTSVRFIWSLGEARMVIIGQYVDALPRSVCGGQLVLRRWWSSGSAVIGVSFGFGVMETVPTKEEPTAVVSDFAVRGVAMSR